MLQLVSIINKMTLNILL